MEVILIDQLEKEIGTKYVDALPKKEDWIDHNGRRYLVLEIIHDSPTNKLKVLQDRNYRDPGFKI